MRRFAALLGLAAALGACGPQTSGTMKGVVVDVVGTLTTVEQFSVLVEGDVITFEPVPDGDFAFPLPHLRDHMRSGEPVLVGWQLEGNRHVATFLDDA